MNRVKRKKKKQIGSSETVVGTKIFKEKKETKDKEQSRKKAGKSPLGILPSKMSTTAYSKRDPFFAGTILRFLVGR